MPTSGQQNWRFSNWIRYEIGTTNALRCKVPEGTIHLVPKLRKKAIIIPERQREAWKGVPVAIWCSECIYSMRVGLGHHILIIPASSPLPPMRGAAADRALTILQNNWFYTRISYFVHSQITSTTRTPYPYHYCSLVKCLSFYISS